MTKVERIQTWLRESARQNQHVEVIATPPFTIFINLDDTSPYANYAIPDIPTGGDLHEPLSTLRVAFHRYGRPPCVTFIEAFAPELAASLRLAGFVEVAHHQVMSCTPETVRSAPIVPGLSITLLGRNSPLADWQAAITVGRRVFEFAAEPAATEAEAEEHRRHWRHFQTLLR